MAGFKKNELVFFKKPREDVVIECLLCFKVMLEPQQVNCCGRNFCKDCIEKVKAANGTCPDPCNYEWCKKEFSYFYDTRCSLVINGLEVYCTNKEKGCEFVGNLMALTSHLSQWGSCEFVDLKCQYERCQVVKQRRHLDEHEEVCDQRPAICGYCNKHEGTHHSVTKEHYNECSEYPVSCPNKCGETLRRAALNNHQSTECPLEPVDCVFSWAGCRDKPLRKDNQEHTKDPNHMSLLAEACGKLKETCGELKETCGQLQKELVTVKKNLKSTTSTCDRLKTQVHQIHDSLQMETAAHSCPIQVLPVNVKVDGEIVHFYTDVCGYHMSVKITRNADCKCTAYAVIHKNTKEVYQPQFQEKLYVYVRSGEEDVPLITHKEANDALAHTSTPLQDLLKGPRAGRTHKVIVKEATFSCPIGPYVTIISEYV